MVVPLLLALAAPAVYVAEGVKVGEVTATSAIVWTRLSSQPAANPGRYESEPRRGQAGLLPAGTDVNKLPGAVPGAAGRARIWYATSENLAGAKQTAWAALNAARDFTAQWPITGLQPATKYYYAVETTGPPKRSMGSFRTAPAPAATAEVRFAVFTGLMYRDLDNDQGFNAFAALAAAPPDFVVMTGDNVYYDNEPPRAVTPALARYHWQRLWSLPRQRALLAAAPFYWEKDDHDTLSDDCWPGKDPEFMKPMTFAQGQRIFLEQAPMGARLYRTFRWGQALQVWLPEGRDFRSPNNAPDGPRKTILGAEQKRWLKDSVEKSDARWRVIVSQTPWVGPDRAAKGDNYANAAFATEGAEMRAWAAALKPANVFVATGDRHWQYHSVDPQTGLNEFSCGPASDEHAGGTPGEDRKYHRFHSVSGGWLEVAAAPDRITFTLRNPAGKAVYTYTAAR